MNPVLRNIVEPCEAYEALPTPIKTAYSEKQWLWLSDAEKATLVQRECEPEE